MSTHFQGRITDRPFVWPQHCLHVPIHCKHSSNKFKGLYTTVRSVRQWLLKRRWITRIYMMSALGTILQSIPFPEPRMSGSKPCIKADGWEMGGGRKGEEQQKKAESKASFTPIYTTQQQREVNQVKTLTRVPASVPHQTNLNTGIPEQMNTVGRKVLSMESSDFASACQGYRKPPPARLPPSGGVQDEESATRDKCSARHSAGVSPKKSMQDGQGNDGFQ